MKYVETKPKYKSKYYANGYPDDDYRVCIDIVAFALRNAGYDLMELEQKDIAENPKTTTSKHLMQTLISAVLGILRYTFRILPRSCPPTFLKLMSGKEEILSFLRNILGLFQTGETKKEYRTSFITRVHGKRDMRRILSGIIGFRAR